MGRGNLVVVRDRSRVSWACPGRFVGPSGRSGTGLVTLEEVPDGLLDPIGSSGQVEGLSGRYGSGGGPSRRFSTG